MSRPKPTNRGTCPDGFIVAMNPKGKLACYKIPEKESQRPQFFRKMLERNATRVQPQVNAIRGAGAGAIKPKRTVRKVKFVNNIPTINWGNAGVPTGIKAKGAKKRLTKKAMLQKLKAINPKTKKDELVNIALAIKNYPTGGPRLLKKKELYAELQEVREHLLKGKEKKKIPTISKQSRAEKSIEMRDQAAKWLIEMS